MSAPAALAGAGFALSCDDIAQLIPHRYPFFILDRVTEVVPGVRAVGVKNISASDPVLAGHFPGRMLYPGVLLVECIAQLAAVVYGSAGLAPAGAEAGPERGGAAPAQADLATAIMARVGYLAEIRQAKFLRPVTPGDQVVFRVENGLRVGSLISVSGHAVVGADLVMQARLAVTQLD